jgi:pilus assembly protein CpaB
MRPGSVIMFAVAFVCAGMAAFLVRAAILVNAAKPSVMQTAVVAVRELKAGEKLAPDMVRETQFPAEFLPRGAYTSRDQIFAGAGEHILAASIAQNEPILAQRLLDSSDSMVGRMNPGMHGVTIYVNETSSVGGFVQPGDHVDVLLTQTEKSETNSTHRPYTKTLLKNVRVLAADQQTQRKADAQPPKTVTLEVTEDDAKKLTLAGAIGQLSLTLNRGDSGADTGRVVDSRDLVAASDQNASEDRPVTIFRSAKREEYRVPAPQ